MRHRVHMQNSLVENDYMAAEYHSSGEYIKHHLQNLTYGQHPDGTWGFAHGMEEAKAMGFWSINVDSMLFSIGLGVLFLFFFRMAAKRATAGAPSGLQNFVEWIVEFIDDAVRGSCLLYTSPSPRDS